LSLYDVFFIALIAVAIFAAAEAHSFSSGAWRRGVSVFRKAVEGTVTLDASFVGREMIAEDAILKLVDERTCLFRRQFRWFQLRTFPLHGEISFGDCGYLVIGRLPYSLLLACLLFVGVFSSGLAEAEGGSESLSSFPLVPLGVVVLTTAFLTFSILVERDRMNSIYPRVVDRLLSKT
jgi:hypothetical protein